MSVIVLSLLVLSTNAIPTTLLGGGRYYYLCFADENTETEVIYPNLQKLNALGLDKDSELSLSISIYFFFFYIFMSFNCILARNL